MSKLFFIGDSITAGAWDERGGWANRLIGQVMAKTMENFKQPGSFYCLPYNLGISGSTVSDNVRSMPAEIAPRTKFDSSNEQIDIVCALGCNDATITVDGAKPLVSQDQFRRDLEEFIVVAKTLAKTVSFIGLIPVDDQLIDSIDDNGKLIAASERVRLFEQIIHDFTTAHGLAFLPLLAKWHMMGNYQQYLIDYGHPNSAGHALLAEQIGEFLFTDEFYQRHSSS
jgi:lysophospholipase L1-like esterase